MSYEAALEALADPMRRRIVEELRRRPSPVGAIAERLPVSRPAVSRHLRVLREAGLVAHDEHGTRNVYRLEPAGVEDLRAWLDEWWEEPLRRYAEYVEEKSDEH